MENLKYYILCPNITSGGPELAHQLCHVLNEFGEEAFMVYYEGLELVHSDTPLPYQKYHVKIEEDVLVINQKNHVLVMPEVASIYYDIPIFSECIKVCWWMSVDNFLGSYHITYDTELTEERFHNLHSMIHLVQSHYALDYVKTRLSPEHLLMVSDYINDVYFENNIPVEYKQNWIAYNPLKGLEEVRKLMKYLPNEKWVPLIQMTPEMVKKCLSFAKLYVDFGSHPGKDRIPREAAVSGCCVLTNRKGSAAYKEDVPIMEQYKFADIEEQGEQIVQLIQDIFVNYEEHYENYALYRNTIYEEKKIFIQQVKDFVDYIKQNIT